ncbi:MAG: isoprenyl transferase [Christensenellales bacterium]
MKRNKRNDDALPQLNVLPAHVAIIMDGNGRWAKTRGLPRIAGHRAGMEQIRSAVRTSSDLGIKYLTFYAFSTENWKRPKDEVSFLMSLLVEFFKKETAELHKNGVKLHILGDWSALPQVVQTEIKKSLALTKDNQGLQVNLALNYGGRDEILRAMRTIAAKVNEGSIKADEITVKDIEDNLYTASIPDPDFIIRTSGELRLSNFLLYQCAYSEFYFTDVNWPDFDAAAYREALKVYETRARRFGGIT